MLLLFLKRISSLLFIVLFYLILGGKSIKLSKKAIKKKSLAGFLFYMAKEICQSFFFGISQPNSAGP
jgi:hypothetical protein